MATTNGGALADPRIGRWGVVLALAFAGSVGCAGRPTVPLSPTQTAARADEPDAVTLVVKGEVVNACPSLVQLREGTDAAPPDARWVVILDRLADCMRTGALSGRSVMLRGAQPSRELVTYVMTARGIESERLAGGADHETVGTRLEISLAPLPAFERTVLTTPAARSLRERTASAQPAP